MSECLEMNIGGAREVLKLEPNYFEASVLGGIKIPLHFIAMVRNITRLVEEAERYDDIVSIYVKTPYSEFRSVKKVRKHDLEKAEAAIVQRCIREEHGGYTSYFLINGLYLRI